MKSNAQPDVIDTQIEIGGRQFVHRNFERRTVAQDQFLRMSVRHSGVDRVMPSDDESDAAFIGRVETTLLASGKAPDIAAGLLKPADAEHWQPNDGKATAQHLGRQDDEAAREFVHQVALDVVFGLHAESARALNRLQASVFAADRASGIRKYLASLFARARAVRN